MIQTPTDTSKDAPLASGCSASPVARLVQRKHLFFAILASNSLIYLPIILAGRPLLDDMARSMGVPTSWAKTGRPLAELFFALINLGYPLTAAQISSQLVALVFLALSGLMVATLFDIKSIVLAAVCTAPLTAHPYFFENMSYVFDAPTMAAALFCAVLAVYMVGTNLSWRSELISLTLTFCSLLLYQPAVTVAFVMGAFTVAWELSKARTDRAIRLGFFFAGSGIVGLGLYWALFASGAILEMHYPHREISSAHLLLNYWSRVWADWGPNGIFFVFLLILIPGLSLFFWRADRSNNYVARLTVAALMIALAVILQHGLPLFIGYEWPFPRTYAAFGTMLALVASTVAASSEKLANRASRLLFNTPAFATYYVLFVIASATGSAMTAQKWFEFGLVTQITQDVSSLNGGRSPHSAHIVGLAPLSPVMINTIKKFPAIRRVVVNPLLNDWIWGHVLFQYYAGPWWRQDLRTLDLKQLENQQPSLVRPWYMIFVVGDGVIVKFRS
jgi:Glucosyl transferase GtrII